MENILFRKISIQTFKDFLKSPNLSCLILRHDVDLLPQNSLEFAKIEAKIGVLGTYYFRAVPESWDNKTIIEIASLGHEVGYHYETMDTAKGDIDLAWDQFRYHLDKLRKLTDVKTICMHGSPRSKYDNKTLWDKYDYKTLGIIGEPYFDIDFNKVFYLTDTGRRWDGWKTSVRDKVPQQIDWVHQELVFHSTQDIIASIKADKFPNKVMMTFHPQRWHDKKIPWLKELIGQSLKNQIKKFLFVER
ncbi:MAG: hypothetical protein K9N35_01550 [Candidatus Marinimicrobia bacterium]|nr:hypothetical protein [Candidatus Neomarinimicrobiota bacterium]